MFLTVLTITLFEGFRRRRSTAKERKLVVNFLGVDGDSVQEGSARVFQNAWISMCQAVRVVVINKGKQDRTLQYGGNGCLEVRIRVRRISHEPVVRVIARHLFSNAAPFVLLNLDALFFSIPSMVKFSGQLARANKVHTYIFWVALISSILPRFRRKVVFTELGGEWSEVAEGRASRLLRLRYAYLGRWVLSRIRVIAQSRSHKRDMVRCGIPGRNITIVQHGRSNPNLFHPTARKANGIFNILYVGRIVPQKGLHVLVAASDILVNKLGLRNIFITVIGPVGGFGVDTTTKYYEDIMSFIGGHGLSNYYKFLGHIPMTELVDSYSRSNVYVLPSIQDAMPSTVTESQMCGTPVIGTYSGGMVDMIVDGVTGFLIPINDPNTLAERLEHLAKHNQECLKMGQNARTWATRSFSIENFSRELLNAILMENEAPQVTPM